MEDGTDTDDSNVLIFDPNVYVLRLYTKTEYGLGRVETQMPIGPFASAGKAQEWKERFFASLMQAQSPLHTENVVSTVGKSTLKQVHVTGLVVHTTVHRKKLKDYQQRTKMLDPGDPAEFAASLRSRMAHYLEELLGPPPE